MSLIDLSSVRVVAISQDLGQHSKGCRLDQSGFTEMVGVFDNAIAASNDPIIINRLGRVEAEGEGLDSCIVDAVIAGILVLTSVRGPFLEAWRAFHGGLAAELPISLEAVLK